MKNTPQTLKGFRDFLPEDMIIRNYVKNIFIEVFENFGFQPLETPTLEYLSTLTGKYGSDADKLLYSFTDKGDRQVGLRYDLTVPAAKILAMYSNTISLPFKRYQIQNIFRAEKPQKGRYREVMQCDIDTFGTNSPTADAEIIAVIYTILNKLKFSKYSIKINSRQVLFDILEKSNIKNNQNSVFQSLDKFQKIGQDGVNKELISKGLSNNQIASIFEYIKTAQPDQNLKDIFDLLKNYGIPDSAFQFDPTMVRGLDYYTDTIFETYVEEPKIGSVTGGGRYNNLVKTLGGPDIPAVGTTIGLDRICDVITELNLLPNLPKTITKVMVANLGLETQNQALSLSSNLRQNNIATVFYPDPEKLGKQIKYALSLNIPYLAIIGTDEAAQNKITLKNLTSQQQQLLSLEEIIDILKR
ncbi:histidine--tRNA ligase [Candidatus Shapirobacteria bacterium RIFOXYC1_FULL_38_24]|uniref:Histidine--tRNA ligase n=2 Tax=Candidatus Shapironibacteriota TaxID=1752721 RepID=A0A0G0JKW7_9BACT|nr:MAG: Histidyl-tRNA synthetase [Candidatus Shapirobacteria bacterium GW2011_GWE2_38_30]KKQ90732.1 MAG: Histidyl-tRNA synthetase [Candidatus Shapirobacteria bacterium GW2011_GWE1_38_92]OGL56741.1 MAG: histidine--tRNA ligase [Candidatus Shapirobacteria bacterium RIFOXYA1_FULL_39_17]OGL56947.1 MAG: histidine--tRNA ligase [Candidatus Shapirobacteria bacterium RIFOXYC1_FULL_38_24]HAP37331.1 histidine--tRNA ligase [Candidatus Shapirobacteria bacterium]